MERVFYIVSPLEDERWSVGVEGEAPVGFPDLRSATEAAANAARELWERYGLASGVRILDREGVSREAHAYGDVNPVAS